MRHRLRLLTLGAFMASLFLGRVAHADEARQACGAAYEKAQYLRHDKKLRASRAQLLICSQSTCPSVVSNDCNQWLKEVESSLPTIVLSARDGSGQDVVNVRVTVDGKPLTDKLDGTALDMDPGPQAFRFEREGMPAVDLTVVIREGEKHRLIPVTLGAPEPAPVSPPPAPVEAAQPAPAPLAPEKPPPTKRSLALPLVVGAAGVATIAVSVIVGIQAKKSADDLRSSCAPFCAKSDIDAVRTKLILSDVTLGVGLVAVGVATYLLLTRSAPAPEHAALRLEMGPTPGGAQVGLHSTF